MCLRRREREGERPLFLLIDRGRREGGERAEAGEETESHFLDRPLGSRRRDVCETRRKREEEDDMDSSWEGLCPFLASLFCTGIYTMLHSYLYHNLQIQHSQIFLCQVGCDKTCVFCLSLAKASSNCKTALLLLPFSKFGHPPLLHT